MSDYSEHLISMAGGDGDPLDNIERRITDCKTYNFGMRNADTLAHFDAPFLLALVKEQQATLAAVLNLANTAGRTGWRISADQLRRTLRGES